MKSLKSFCFFFLLCFFVQTLVAQTTIKGSVVSDEGKPISKASVFLPETYEGGETDSKGNFSFTTEEKDSVLVVASHINHYTDTIRLVIKSNKSVPEELRFILRPQMNVVLDELLVSSVASMGVSETKSKNALSTLDVYTTPAANADLSYALRSTPGLQDVGNQAGFFVRGGADNETGVVIDGVRVQNFFKKSAPNVASRSRIEAGMFKGMVLGIGGYSPQYGNALSGMLELNTNDMPKKSTFDIGLSPIFASLQAGFFGLKRKTYTEMSYSYNNIYYVQPFLRKEWSFDPIGYAHALRLRNVSKPSENGELRFTLFSDYSNGGTKKTSQPSNWNDFIFNNRENYLLSTLNYKHYLHSGMTLTFIGGYSRNENRSRFENKELISDIETQTIDDYKQIGLNLKYENGRFSSLQGVEYNRSSLKLANNSFSDGNSAAFFNAMQQLSDNWLLTVGLRGEYSDFLKSGIILPRLSLTHTFTKSSTLTLDGGSYSQIANYFFPTQTLSRSYAPVGRENSEQYNLTYQFLPRDGNYILRFQLFNKQYRSLTRIENDHLINDGKGYARGVDLFFKDSKTFNSFKYRLAYSYIDSKRNFLYYPIMAQPSFVANHNASLVVQKFVPEISSQFNISLSFNSGFPYYNPNLSNDKFMSDKTPACFDMNFSYNKLFSLGSINGVAVLSVTNILASNSVLTYEYSRIKNRDGLYPRQSIISPTKPFVFLGVFFNIGNDNRNEIIDKYL